MNILLGINTTGTVRVGEILPLLLPYRSKGDLVEKAWGISLHQQKTARLFKDDVTAQKAAYHGFAHDHEGHGLLAQTILSEGQAVTAYADIAPFARELGGRVWTFTHDSDLPNLDQLEVIGFRPIGTSAAERAFCLLLDTARDYLGENGEIPDPQKMLHRLARETSRISASGHFNYMLSNGDYLFVHSHTQLDILMAEDDAEQRDICLVASQQMTDDDFWSCLLPHSLTMIRNGKIIGQVRMENPADTTMQKNHAASLRKFQQNRRAAIAERQEQCAGDGHLYECS